MQKKSLRKSLLAVLCMATTFAAVAGVTAAVNPFYGRGASVSVSAETQFSNPITPEYSGKVNPDGVTYARVRFFVQSAQGLSKDVWDNNVEKNSDLILISYRKNGVVTENKTVPEVKAALGDASIKRVVYTYDDADGGLWLNLVFHMDDHSSLAPADIVAVTVKKGFQWYGSALTAVADTGLNSDVYFYTDNAKMERAASALVLSGEPAKAAYETGETFDPAGMKATITYKDGGSEEVNVSADMCTYDFSTAGEKEVVVSYGGASATKTIAVSEPEKTVSSIGMKAGYSISLVQYVKTVSIGEGSKITVAYSDDSQEEIDLTEEMISGLTNEAAGSYQATIAYKGQTCQADYTVAAYTAVSAISGINYGTNYKQAAGNAFSVTFDRTDSGQKAISAVNLCPSAIIGKTLGDLVLIEGETVTSLVSQGKVARFNFYGGELNFHVDNAEYLNKLMNDGYVISILPGFQWLTFDRDDWGNWGGTNALNYTPIEGAIVTSRMEFSIVGGKISKPVESISFTGTEYKNEYNKDDKLDFTGMTLVVTYNDDTTAVIDLTADMVAYDFSEGGEKTVEITYAGKTASFTVTVNDKTYTALTIKTAPDKLTYDWGMDQTLDLTGAVVEATLHDNVADTDEQIVVPVTGLEVSGYNCANLGTQTVTLSYAGLEATFEVTVENITTDAYAYLIPDSGTSYEVTTYHSLKIAFGYSDSVTVGKKALWNISAMPNVADHILINGVRADVLMNTKVNGVPLLARICTYGGDLIFHLDSSFLVPTSDIGKAPDYVKYIEGQSMVVARVEFLAGFQFYYAEADSWGSDPANGNSANPGGVEYVAVPGGILKENVTVINLNGDGWVRELKTNVYGALADDAISFTAPTKLVYNIGEKLDIAGAELNVKYADGGSEKVALTTGSFKGFSSEEAGEYTISYMFNGNRIEFVVTVVDPNAATPEDSSGSGGGADVSSGCGSFATGAAALASVAILGGAAMLVSKKKKD